MDLFGFGLFRTTDRASGLTGRAFYILGRPVILIGFYRTGVALWCPIVGSVVTMRFGRFKRELNRKLIAC